MSNQRVVLSQADTNRQNIGKKRPSHPEETKDFTAKKNRNSGDPYRGRNGLFHPGILPPEQVI